VEKMPKLKSMKKRTTDGDEEEEEAQEEAQEEEQEHQNIKLQQLQQQPPKEITQNIRGQKRDYYYLTTVKSLEQLDKFRFKVVQTTGF
jgi:hypothetical protein